MSEGARTAGLGGFLGYSDPAGSLVCIVRPDGSAAALNIIPAEIYGTRVLRGVSCLWLGVPSKPGCVVLCWLGVVVMVGKCVALVSPGDVVKNSGLLRSTFQESHCLIGGEACALSWKCILSQPWAKKIKTDSRECPRKTWKCKRYIT